MAVDSVQALAGGSYAHTEPIVFGLLIASFGYVGVRLLKAPNKALAQAAPV